MIITIVSEMSRSKFQWSDAWGIDKQIEKDSIVIPFEFSKDAYLSLPKEDKHWNVLRQADLIMVYCTRINDPTDKWAWWRLPEFVKGFMKPEAKMIAQIDDDWVPLFHPDWGWWQDYPYGKVSPKKFFKDTGILDIPDLWLTVLENPEFAKFTKKPVKYCPLPQLSRYQRETTEGYHEYLSKGAIDMHGNCIGILRHSSKAGSVQHTVTNVIDKINAPAIYFSCEHGGVKPLVSKKITRSYPYLNRNEYMRILRHDCKVAIDDTENYIGWSRFTMEAAINYIPCVGSNQSAKRIYPDLYTEHYDYPKQIELINKLLNDNDFYIKMVEQGRNNLKELTDDAFVNKVIEYAKELGVNSSPFDVRKELFLCTLDKFLPFEKLPIRPQSKEDIVYDRIHTSMIDQAKWDIYYGKFVDYINDEKVYNAMIGETLRRKDSGKTGYFEIY